MKLFINEENTHNNDPTMINSSDCEVVEVVVWPRALTTEEMQAVSDHMMYNVLRKPLPERLMPSDPVPPPFSAPTGGIVTTSGDYIIHTFTTVGNTDFVVNSELSVEILVVAGGGGGGGDNSGGGGAGGLIYYGEESGTNRSTPNGPIQTFTTGTYVITVGDGGAGSKEINQAASNGGDSKIDGPGFVKTATGGGYGGTGNGGMYNGGNGGSGGGGAHETTRGFGGSSTGNVDDSIQGYAGGDGGPSHNTGGGGGGAGGAGNDGQTHYYGGAGGDGAEYSISGTATWYAAGGNGGHENNHADNVGRQRGIGGRTNQGTNYEWIDGVANTGSGGAGVTHGWSGYGPSNTKGGKGGSGIVIIRYPKPYADYIPPEPPAP
jgi:hypothetical protein